MTESGSESEIEIDVEEEAASRATTPADADPDRDDARTDAERLADELGRTELRTTDEGYVEARVVDLEAVDETTVRLRVRLPTGEELSFALRKPVPWSEEFLLARLVRWVGYDAATVDHLIGERVLLERSTPESDAPADAVWSEGTRRPSAVQETLSAFGFSVGTGDAPDWRLVDPRELDDADAVELSPRTRLLLGATATILLLIGISVLGAAAPAVTTWLVLTALAGTVTVLFVLYAAVTLLRAFGG